MGLPPTAHTPLTDLAASCGAAPASLSPWGGVPAATAPVLTQSGGTAEVVLAQWPPGQAHGAVVGAAEWLPRQPCWLRPLHPAREEGGREGGRDGRADIAGRSPSICGQWEKQLLPTLKGLLPGPPWRVSSCHGCWGTRQAGDTA